MKSAWRQQAWAWAGGAETGRGVWSSSARAWRGSATGILLPAVYNWHAIPTCLYDYAFPPFTCLPVITLPTASPTSDSLLPILATAWPPTPLPFIMSQQLICHSL